MRELSMQQLVMSRLLKQLKLFQVINLKRDQIDTNDQVKEIGLHTVTVVLGPDTKFDTTLEVVPETK
jgi:ribosomal protein L9